MGYFAILLVFSVLGYWVSNTLKQKFEAYNKIKLHSDLSGAEIARQMLLAHQLPQVQVLCVKGQLSDHYDPSKKTVNLSEAVFYGKSTAAAAVAAHECGHAVQDAQNYPLLGLRSSLVPLQMVASQLMSAISIMSLVGGLALKIDFQWIILVIIGCYACFALFSLITLPVEIDASKKALNWLQKSQIVQGEEEYNRSYDALKWAALTYIIAALSALSIYIFLFLQARNNRQQ